MQLILSVFVSLLISTVSGKKLNFEKLPILKSINVSVITISHTVTTKLAALRKTNVKSDIIYTITDYGGGQWKYDSTDNKSVDNTGTVLVTIFNQRIKRIFHGPLNVLWFGARGDSLTDATNAINLSLLTAHIQNLSLYLPTGIYSCNNKDVNNHVLNFYAGSNHSISIRGDGVGSKITSKLSTTSILLYIYSYETSNNVTIQNLFFESTHVVTSALTQGIFLQGTKGENLVNTSISMCTFEGFCNDIGAQGCNNLAISNNIFNAPKGHDNAQNNTNPAVFLWFFDNANGYCSNINIINNIANGYSSVTPVNKLVSKRPMDGFLYGTGYGFLITGNSTKNFSEEHIAIAPTSTFPNADKQIIIKGNVFDDNIPIGSLNQNGTIHNGNYAIRCDAGNASISGNTIYNFTTGIMVRTFDYPKLNKGNYAISGNKLYAANSQNGLLINAGITVQGSLDNRLHNLVIENNFVNITSSRAQNAFIGILVYDTDTALVENNTISVAGLISTNNMNSYGRVYGRVNMVSDCNNTVKGIIAHNGIASTDQVIFQN